MDTRSRIQRTRRTIPLLIFGLLWLAASGFQHPASAVKVEDAYVRPVAKGMTSAGYFRISNSSDIPDTLYDVKADFAEMAQLHESYRENGLVGMRRVEFVVVPADSSIEFEPGGYHIMLMSVKENLKIGMKLRFKLFFKQNGTVEVDAVVKE
ncbi:MAG TPA: copper chaperone PCu(A)C [Candidatus Acidoferrales bacterium]|nr:copper chaperone PCu(A)C [Candidatus Acidoferrales bacterium]